MNKMAWGTCWFVVFMIAVTAWRVWETFHKQGRARGRTSMMWSFYALFAMSCVIFAGTVLEFFFVPRPRYLAVSLAGVVLFVLSNCLRIVAIRTLGRFWSLHIEIREQHQFVRHGPYRYVRHPAYASFILESVAIPLVGNAWWSAAVAVLVYVPLLLLRIKREEVALVEKFGGRYKAYQREVGALIPRWPAKESGSHASQESA